MPASSASFGEKFSPICSSFQFFNMHVQCHCSVISCWKQVKLHPRCLSRTVWQFAISQVRHRRSLVIPAGLKLGVCPASSWAKSLKFEKHRFELFYLQLLGGGKWCQKQKSILDGGKSNFWWIYRRNPTLNVGLFLHLSVWQKVVRGHGKSFFWNITKQMYSIWWSYSARVDNVSGSTNRRCLGVNDQPTLARSNLRNALNV